MKAGAKSAALSALVASALPADGRLVTLELEEKCARVARNNLERAGLLPAARP